jgi:hypothetical protein
MLKYKVEVDYGSYAGAARRVPERTATLEVWGRDMEEARGQAREHVAAIVGHDHVGDIEVDRIVDEAHLTVADGGARDTYRSEMEDTDADREHDVDREEFDIDGISCDNCDARLMIEWFPIKRDNSGVVAKGECHECGMMNTVRVG